MYMIEILLLIVEDSSNLSAQNSLFPKLTSITQSLSVVLQKRELKRSDDWYKRLLVRLCIKGMLDNSM